MAELLRDLQPLDADERAIKALRRPPGVNLIKGCVGVADVAAFLLAVTVAYLATREIVDRDPVPFADYALVAALDVPVLIVILVSRCLYMARFVARRSDELRRLVDSLLLAMGALVVVSFLLKIQVSRTWIVLSFFSALVAMWAERELVRQLFRHRRMSGRSSRRVVLVGSNGEIADLVTMLRSDRSLGYDVVAVVDGSVLGEELLSPAELVDSAIQAVRETGAAGVVVSATSMDAESSTRLLRVLTHAGLHVEITSALSDVSTSRISIRPLGRYPVLYIEPVARFGWRPVAKRTFDLVASIVILAGLAPLLAVVALLVRFTSPGPVLFRQRRLGRDGATFELLKFRSMVADAETRLIELRDANEADGPLFKLRDDPRITRLGGILRRTSIDELPQLWNVVRGEMSLVGPRPALPSESVHWSPPLFHRLRVRPGITGMWQVSGRSDTKFDEYARLDLYYVDNWSLIVDLAIILRTIPAVLAARGAR